ncbi:bacteriorhodopsin [Qipengyuania sp. JC766]|uniref:bacteriorhodopsin n=1 Tax=Qipengyuania sp. JC766 TaxID=3232139 RepID=UPI003458A2BF
MQDLTLPLVIGFVVMALGSLAIYAHGDKRTEYLHHTQFHSVVPFIAATAYLAMTLGIGRLELVSGETIFLARYADWIVTTPILLTGLVMAGLHEHPRHSTYILPVVILDALMIVTGLLGALATNEAEKWIWFAWSCAAFVGIIWLLLGPVMRAAKALGGELTKVYTANLAFLLIVWSIYPLEWALGPQGLGLFDAVADAWVILVLDVTAKVIYGFVATARFKKLSLDAADRKTLTASEL